MNARKFGELDQPQKQNKMLINRLKCICTFPFEKEGGEMTSRHKRPGIHKLGKIFDIIHDSCSDNPPDEDHVGFSMTEMSHKQPNSSNNCCEEKENIWQPWNLETQGRLVRILEYYKTSQPYNYLALYYHYTNK